MLSNLKIFFKYNEDSPSGLSTLNGIFVGYKSKDRLGNYAYWKINKNKSTYSIHRIIWALLNGEIPENMVINHIDNNGLNNRINNLEICTQAENNRRTKMHTGRGQRKDNALQVTGVKVITAKGYRYTIARIRFNKVLYEKAFSHLLYTEEQAKELAIQWRNNKIAEFNSVGAGFSLSVS